MNERLKELRKALGLTLESFGEKIGLGKSAVSRMENGLVGVTDQTVKSICREFGVSETWLRDGVGEMYDSDSDKILDTLAKQHKLTEMERAAIIAFIRLSESDRAAIMRYVDALVEAVQAVPEKQPETDAERADRLEKENQALAERYAALEKELAQLEGRGKPEAV